MLSVSDATGLLSGLSWNTSTLTYGFAESVEDFPSNYDADDLPEGDVSLSPSVQNYFGLAFAHVAEFVDLTFSEVEADDSGNWADLAVSASTKTAVASAYFPARTDPAGGDIRFNIERSFFDPLEDPDKSVIGTFAWHAVLHEIGHSLGLKHPHDTEIDNKVALPIDLDEMSQTLMSYKSYASDTLGSGYTNGTNGYAQTLMPLDIAALQAIYGPNMDTASGDTTYTIDPQTGEVFRDGETLGAPLGNTTFSTLWDASGTDTLDLSNHANPLNVDLAGGGGADLDVGGDALRAFLGDDNWVDQQLRFAIAPKVAPNALIENVIGGSQDDTLTGNALSNLLMGREGDDALFGLAGNDTFYGGAGSNTIDGGDGSDLAFVQTGDVLNDTGSTGYDKAQIYDTDGLEVTLTDWTGIERVNGYLGADIIDGSTQETALLLFGHDGDDVLIGGLTDDVLIGGAGDDTLTGGDGNDAFLGNAGADTFDGGAGNDVFFIDDAGDMITNGGDGFDKAVIAITDGLDIALVGWSGVERINGLTGDDTIDASSLDTGIVMAAGLGDDTLTGSAKDDVFYAGGGSDLVFGGAGDDALIGAGGDDYLDGGAGNDFFLGGTGADRFVWTTGFGQDVVKDFTIGEDLLDFSGAADVVSFAEFALSQDGDHTVLRLVGDTDNQVTLLDIDDAALSAADFVFALA